MLAEYVLAHEGSQMATKAINGTRSGQTQEESSDALLIDSTEASVKKLLARGKERGFVTYDELNAALPPDEVSSATQIMTDLQGSCAECSSHHRSKLRSSVRGIPAPRQTARHYHCLRTHRRIVDIWSWFVPRGRA